MFADEILRFLYDAEEGDGGRSLVNAEVAFIESRAERARIESHDPDRSSLSPPAAATPNAAERRRRTAGLGKGPPPHQETAT